MSDQANTAQNAITPFLFDGEHVVRVVMHDGEPWFVANDVARLLGYAVPKDAVAAHCKGAVKRRLPTQQGGSQEMAIIPERDVYRLIMRSKLPAAERFEEWVVGEVLPTIRKTGGYFSPNAAAPLVHLLLDPGQIRATVKLIDETRRLKGRAAAVALWDQLGLGIKPGPDGQAVPTIVG